MSMTTAKKYASHPILNKFFPCLDGCSGSCQYEFDNTTGGYQVVNSDCSGTCSCPDATASIRDLLALEGADDGLGFSLNCTGLTASDLRDIAIRNYIEVRKQLRLWKRIAAGLGALFGITLIGVIYLLTR
jgi:hypothetical protein